MKIVDNPQGRLGNAIFRYLASSLFGILYKAERSYDSAGCSAITDEFFINWKSAVEKGLLPSLPNTSFLFYGFFQHDAIYRKYKRELIDHILKNPSDILKTDGNNGSGPYHYNSQTYKSIQLLEHNIPIKYDFVIHLRLEDFLINNTAIHSDSLIQLLNKIKQPNMCIVVNKIKTDLEHEYIDNLRKHFSFYVESNDIITDFHIMKNAKILVCSCSTISWAAALLSETVETVYMPNYPNTRIHETFRKPIENTVFYDYKTISK